MTKQSLSIDELLSKQVEPSLLATVEAVQDKPELVKITPWRAAAGCLCHLSLRIPKGLLDGATPTGDMHVCCGKTLQVVQLHLKTGESLNLEDVIGQLHAASTETAHTHPEDPAGPARAPGPPLPTPPPWGWGWPPWLRHPEVDPRRFAATSRYPYPYCQSNYDRCVEECFYSPDRERCQCLCGSIHALCQGRRIIQPC